MFDKTTILRITFLVVGLGLAAIPKCDDPRCSYNRVIGHAAHSATRDQNKTIRTQTGNIGRWSCPLCTTAKPKTKSIE